MEIIKRSIGSRVYELAETYGIEQVITKSIIYGFLDYCMDCLGSGERVDFLGLVSFIPSTELYDMTTLAFKCYRVADILGLPHHTVYCIIHEYLLTLKEELLKGNSIEIRGMVAMYPIVSDGVTIKVYSRISSLIKCRLEDYDSGIESVRVQTHKLLKRRLWSEAESVVQ